MWRKIQTLGLSNKYKEDDEFRLYCGLLDALALLPLSEIQEAGMKYLKDTASEAAHGLVSYFDKTYVSGELKQRKRRPANPAAITPITIRRIPPLFVPEQWNMHQVTMDNQPRTNNVSEGWNNKFSCPVSLESH